MDDSPLRPSDSGLLSAALPGRFLAPEKAYRISVPQNPGAIYRVIYQFIDKSRRHVTNTVRVGMHQGAYQFRKDARGAASATEAVWGTAKSTAARFSQEIRARAPRISRMPKITRYCVHSQEKQQNSPHCFLLPRNQIPHLTGPAPMNPGANHMAPLPAPCLTLYFLFLFPCEEAGWM